MEPYSAPDEIPNNCRIDDYTVAKLLDSGMTAKALNFKWPMEIDQKKMVKAVRMPLGFAAKMFVKKRHDRP